MLPVGNGNGQLWRKDQFLCSVGYEISEPLQVGSRFSVQRVLFTVAVKDDHGLLKVYVLILIAADGNRYELPHSLQRSKAGKLECYVESPL